MPFQTLMNAGVEKRLIGKWTAVTVAQIKEKREDRRDGDSSALGGPNLVLGLGFLERQQQPKSTA